MQRKSNFEFLDLITIISFLVGLYALNLGVKNLEENREQSKSQQELLNYLEEHLKNQDDHLQKQDELMINLTK